MKTKLFLATAILCLSLSCKEKKPTELEEYSILNKEFLKWNTLGVGEASVNNDVLVIEEKEGSDGFFLVSPDAYRGNMKIQFDFKAVSESSVMILLFSASDSSQEVSLTLPVQNASSQEINSWRREMNHYNLTFNNESHGYTPFFFKNISQYERDFHLRAKENKTIPNQWYNIEIERSNEQVLFKIDNEIIFQRKDHEPLLGGHLLLRVSGTNDGEIILAKVNIRDFRIYN